MPIQRFGGALLTLAVLAGPAFAQGTTTAEGIVLDQEGIPVPDVQILMNYKGHIIQKYRTKTDKKGKFVHVNVYGGTYDITMKKEGLGEAVFKDFTFRDLASTEKLPVFRLGMKKVAATPAPDPSATPEQAAAAVAAVAAVQAAGLAAADFDAANAAMRAGQVDAAIAGYEKVIAQVPILAEAHQNLGLALSRKGDKARAEAEFRQAAELKPGFVDAHRALSLLLYDAGRRDEALAEAAKAAEADPKSAILQYNLGVMYANAGKGDEARTALLKAEELDPSNAEVQYLLGTVAISANEKAEAIARLEKYLSMAAGAPNAAAAQAMVTALKK